MNNATTVLLVGAIAAAGAVRARNGSRLLRTDVTPTFDVGEIFARKPKPPRRCEVWLRNRANVNGLFVVGAIRQVFGLGNNDAWRVCLDAHHNGVALVAEIEKVNVKLDFVILELAKYNDIIKQGIADAEPVPDVAPVALDAAHTLAMHEMRMILTTEQSQMRVYMRNLAIAMAMFVFVMSIVVMIAVYAIVYRLKEPAVCESTPSPVCQMSDEVCLKCMAGYGFQYFQYARDMLNQPLFQK